MPLPAWLARANRRITNPLLGRISSRLPPLATVHHVGRKTGRCRSTPIMAFRQPHGFVVALTYGSSVQWLRNVEAASGGALTQRGRRYPVGAPRRLEGRLAQAALPGWVRGLLQLMDVSEFVELPDA